MESCHLQAYKECLSECEYKKKHPYARRCGGYLIDGNYKIDQDHSLTYSPPGPIPLYRHPSDFFTTKMGLLHGQLYGHRIMVVRNLSMRVYIPLIILQNLKDSGNFIDNC